MKRLIALFLSCVLLLGALPFAAFAQGGTVYRVFGANRYETSKGIADMLAEVNGTDKFTSVIVASGTNFPDALAGSYLAAVTGAPILLTAANRSIDMTWFRENVAQDAQVYILGGTAVVSENTEKQLKDYQVERLAGATRYETNLLILKKAMSLGGSTKDLLVSTGSNFADSLSASATGKAILLVGNTLNSEQKSFLASSSWENIYILGGTGAVAAGIEGQLAAYGPVTRISGKDRYETSVQIAECFFPEADSAILAYAKNFPDGLCGGPLAYSMDAPLILTQTGKEALPAGYTANTGIDSGAVLGGEGLISNASVKKIFGTDNITVYEKGLQDQGCGHGETTLETKEATCQQEGYTRTLCALCGEILSETAVPELECSYTVTKRMNVAAKEMTDKGDMSFAKFGNYTDWDVDVCSGCGYPDIDTLRFAYTPEEAAEIMLGYVNELREEVFGTDAYNLVLNEEILELALIRAEEISINYAHGGTYTGCSENIVNGGVNIYDQFLSWKNSSGHYNTMIQSSHTDFAYAVYQPATGTYLYGVQLFW